MVVSKQKAIVFILGIILAVGSVVGFNTYSENLVQKVDVVVATDIIEPMDTVIEGRNVEVRKVAAEYLVPGAITDITEVNNKLSSSYIFPGEQVLNRDFQSTTVNPKIGEDYCFIEVKNRVLKPGDIVDVVIIYNNKNLRQNEEPRKPYKIFEDKVVAQVLDSQAKPMYDTVRGSLNNPNSTIGGIEILATNKQIMNYLNEVSKGVEVYIVRKGNVTKDILEQSVIEHEDSEIGQFLEETGELINEMTDGEEIEENNSEWDVVTDSPEEQETENN